MGLQVDYTARDEVIFADVESLWMFCVFCLFFFLAASGSVGEAYQAFWIWGLRCGSGSKDPCRGHPWSEDFADLRLSKHGRLRKYPVKVQVPKGSI